MSGLKLPRLPQLVERALIVLILLSVALTIWEVQQKQSQTSNKLIVLLPLLRKSQSNDKNVTSTTMNLAESPVSDNTQPEKLSDSSKQSIHEINHSISRTLEPHPGSPPQTSPYAYATLCLGNATVAGAAVLFHSLRATASTIGDFVVLAYNLPQETLDSLHRLGIRTYEVAPLQFRFLYLTSNDNESNPNRDGILWTKLRAWQLEDYDKVVMMDCDMIALQCIDELFEMPEFSGVPMVDAKREKIQFWKTGEYNLRAGNIVQRGPDGVNRLATDWSGLNSGITVLKPSNETFSDLLGELEIVPGRPCCPSQEFLYHFFEARRRFFRLPQCYNGRMFPDKDMIKLGMTKVYHYLGKKPWRRKNKSKLNKLWWIYKHEVDAMLGSPL
ncbi:nucleotide-diphospho-sugar transferase [Cladochytrium replicatum]|nr:nucleotide-diphospho-sugar transferase [Cladochytrium replicatum]